MRRNTHFALRMHIDGITKIFYFQKNLTSDNLYGAKTAHEHEYHECAMLFLHSICDYYEFYFKSTWSCVSYRAKAV
jgi:hypothetical protein